MKCPVCEQQGKKSTLRGGGSFTTCMCGETYWDEDGKYHNHDPNRISTGYHCSNGHEFSVSSRSPCQSCEYGHEKPKITVSAP